jgi:hypothetical protein
MRFEFHALPGAPQGAWGTVTKKELRKLCLEPVLLIEYHEKALARFLPMVIH